MPMVLMRDQTPLYVRTLGRGQPVLMLPGLGMNSRHWLPWVLPYAHRCRFYMPDFRGHGRSAAARLNQNDVFQNHMEDTQDVIAHFGLHDFLLAGISLGGTTALHLRQQAGWAGVRSYLHIDQSPCVMNRPDWPYGLAGEAQPRLFALMHQVLERLPQKDSAAYFDQLPAELQLELAAILARILELLGSNARTLRTIRRLPQLPRPILRRLPLMRLDDLRAYLQAYSGGGHDYRPSLDLDEVPVTLMIGMQSVLYAAEGQLAIARRAKRARIVCFERSGHAPLASEPIKFLREFGRFLTSDPHAESFSQTI